MSTKHLVHIYSIKNGNKRLYQAGSTTLDNIKGDIPDYVTKKGVKSGISDWLQARGYDIHDVKKRNDRNTGCVFTFTISETNMHFTVKDDLWHWSKEEKQEQPTEPEKPKYPKFQTIIITRMNGNCDLIVTRNGNTRHFYNLRLEDRGHLVYCYNPQSDMCEIVLDKWYDNIIDHHGVLNLQPV